MNRRLSPRGAYRLMQGLSDRTADPQVAICQLLFDSWLVSNCLDLGDRVSMANGVEARVPLLDATLIETVVGFWKAGRTEDSQGHKVWLRANARDLLPPEVLESPQARVRDPDAAMDVGGQCALPFASLGGSLVDTGVLDGDRLRRWVEHTPAGLHRDFFQYKLTLLEIWNRIVVQGQTPQEIT